MAEPLKANVPPDAQDDWELLQRYRMRGPDANDAFAALVRRHAGLVYHACRRRLRDAALAQDVSQAVFVLLARRGPTRGKGASLAAWLYRTADHACANAARARARRARHEQTAAGSADSEARVRQSMSSQSTDPREAMLEEALASIAPADRDLLVMRYYEDRDLDELGHTLGISSNTVSKRLSRAADHVRRFFASRGQIVPAASLGPMLVGALRQPAAPELMNHLVLASMAPVTSPAVEAIVKGVIDMLVRTKVKLVAGVTAIVIIAGSALSVAVSLAQTPPAKPPGSDAAAAAPATQPAPAPAQASSPKQVLKQFAAAVRKGDAKTMTALSIIADAEDQRLVDAASEYVNATASFRKAVAAKFGAAGERELAPLFELTPVGRFSLLIETTVDKAPETIEGDTAMIQPREIEDLTFWLLRDRADGRWKLSPQRMTENWTPQQREERLGLMRMAAAALARFTERVNDGEYANFQELKADLGPVVRQNR